MSWDHKRGQLWVRAFRHTSAMTSSAVWQVDDADFFWALNGRNPFPKMAEDVDNQLQKYKAAIEELNRKTGADEDPNAADPNDLMQVAICVLP